MRRRDECREKEMKTEKRVGGWMNEVRDGRGIFGSVFLNNFFLRKCFYSNNGSAVIYDIKYYLIMKKNYYY